MADRYHGKELQVYLSTSAAGAASPAVGITAWTFDGSTDKADATAAGDANKVTVLGTPSANGTFSFVWDVTDTVLFAAAEAGEEVKVYVYRDAANLPTHYRYGYAFIDISEDANITSAVSGSGTFSAAGSWARKP